MCEVPAAIGGHTHTSMSDVSGISAAPSCQTTQGKVKLSASVKNPKNVFRKLTNVVVVSIFIV